MTETTPATGQPHLNHERQRLLQQVATALDRPMTVLAFVGFPRISQITTIIATVLSSGVLGI